MLTRLFISNFKAWNDRLWPDGVALAPITLVLGPNSVGKTSLLQAPLLLKQTLTTPPTLGDLTLTGDLIDVGTAHTAIHRTPPPPPPLGLGLDLTTDHGTLHHRATFHADGPALALASLTLADHAASFSATRTATGAFELRSTSPPTSQSNTTFHPIQALRLSPSALAALGPHGPRAAAIGDTITNALTHLAYLGPLRDRPPRAVATVAPRPPGDLGARGEHAFEALLFAALHASPLFTSVAAWLAALGVADDLILDAPGPSGEHSLSIVRGPDRASLADVGFGITQVLPFLVLAFHAAPGATLLVEQPELHLHPRAQAILAELLVTLTRTRGLRFLVETHSEPLFRRLQTLIAEEKVAAAACRFYYVDRDAQRQACLTELAIDPFGRITPWPPALFGDAMGETERQTRLMIERLRNPANRHG